jgi:hypothetical protein
MSSFDEVQWPIFALFTVCPLTDRCYVVQISRVLSDTPPKISEQLMPLCVIIVSTRNAILTRPNSNAHLVTFVRTQSSPRL